MIDKSMSIFLLLVFGISGAAILVLAWVQPMPVSERIMTTLVGSAGILVALSRALVFKSLRPRTGAEQGLVEVKVEDKS